MSALSIEYILFALYVLIGPTIWVLFRFAMIKGRERMLLMNRPAARLENPPRVTILIPAKDEGERTRACLDAALTQDYPNFSVIAIDDRSTDNTGTIMDEIASQNDKLRVMHIPHGDLPKGWTGKTHALHSAVPAAAGEWLMFIDSDVIVQPDAVSSAMELAVGKPCDLVSLLPRIESGGFWEQLIIPIAGAALSWLYLVALTNNDHLRTAFANGQFILIRRSAYEQLGGHERVRAHYCEDIELAKLAKRAGMRVRICWGNEFAAVRMYSSFAQILRGWGRLFFAGSDGRPWRVLIAIAFVVMCSLSAYAALFWGIFRSIHPVNAYGHIGWLLAAGVHLIVMTYCISILYAWSGNHRRSALLFPLCAMILLRIFARSLAMCITGKVEWRGTRYAWRNSKEVAS